MPDTRKPDQILDALEKLLTEKQIQNISVSEIAKAAGMGKGSIYYYFPSKEAILSAMIERSYEEPIQTAKKLASQEEIPPFTRMAMMFQACRSASTSFLNHKDSSGKSSLQEQAFLIQKYSHHLVSELKPALTKIIEQGISRGEIHFDYPDALSEIVLIVLVVKLSKLFSPSESEEIDENTLRGLISLLEKGTNVPEGSLEYLLYKD